MASAFIHPALLEYSNPASRPQDWQYPPGSALVGSDCGIWLVLREEGGERVGACLLAPFYMAPEILLDKPYGTAGGYSFAIVIWETLAHKDPYEGKFESHEEMLETINMDEVADDP